MIVNFVPSCARPVSIRSRRHTVHVSNCSCDAADACNRAHICWH